MNYLGVPGFLSMSKMLQWSILSWMENSGVVKLLSYKGYIVYLVWANPIADESALMGGLCGLWECDSGEKRKR